MHMCTPSHTYIIMTFLSPLLLSLVWLACLLLPQRIKRLPLLDHHNHHKQHYPLSDLHGR